jgi:PIN domain nuclease of toxin-antitoxin system
MRLLLDTHVVLAILARRVETLTPAFQQALGDADNERHVSVASLWEIAIKWRLGKLELTVGLDALPGALDALDISVFAIEAAHVLAAAEPEPKTRDPFDRLLLAQCKVEGLQLLTTDRALAQHPLSARM